MYNSRYYDNYSFQNKHQIPLHPVYNMTDTDEEKYYYPYHENMMDPYLPKRYKKKNSTTRSRRNSLNSRHSKLYKGSLTESNVYDSEYEELNDDYYFHQGQQRYRRLSGVRSVSPYRQHENNVISERRVTLDPNLSRVHQNNNAFLNYMPQHDPMTNAPKTNYYGNHHHTNGLGVGVTSKTPFIPMTTNALVPPFHHLNNHNRNELLLMPQPTVPMISPHFVSDNINFWYPPPYQLYNHSLAASTNMCNTLMPAAFIQCANTNFNKDLSAANNTDSNININNGNNNLVITEDEAHKPKTASPISCLNHTEPKNDVDIANDENASSKVLANDQSGKRPVLIRRRKSLMEGILSSFSLLEEPENYTVVSDSTNLAWDQQLLHNMEANTFQEFKNSSQISNSSESAVALGNDGQISTEINQGYVGNRASTKRSSSLRLTQKANLLKSREYIWCYRPKEENKNTLDEKSVHPLVKSENNATWSAFDLTNQNILDRHYSFVIANRSNFYNAQQNQPSKYTDNSKIPFISSTTDPSSIIELNKQANITGSIIVSIQDGIAWHKKEGPNSSSTSTSSEDKVKIEEFDVFELSYMPTRLNTLVFTKDSIEETNNALTSTQIRSSLRRSKSMDRITNKLFKTILRW